ncbi:MAG: hypothetical protein UR98_C0014G0013 [Parcubacteria group bacterium GW2011_GWA1_36_12]|uniref:Nucleotide exchange factor GrpE n=1 Tax=Candidatus Daviesbacteria bacterium GW2011_GWB1_41_5 TaxID=1618429 RepID=A0A0G0YW06_9BACT|nr:MAG: hypothetical protein UR98_C0014G0013 [Parcubacteria group bacterium GW2011_GWA1_36_12]KKS13876.1 MAG: hypothetical protein UU67_C0014G0010 [Candidatus Daviesbacteria bacterium GW2011_GWB1_41_5]
MAILLANLGLILLAILLVFLLALAVSSYIRLSKKIESTQKILREEIRFSLQPMTDIPMGVEEIVELAIDVWKMEQRLLKVSGEITEVHRKGLENSIQRLKRYLEKFDVEVQDYTVQKYNDGLNFDILAREKDDSLEYPIIKETVEPTITCRGRIVKKAKVILASNQT